MNSNQEAKFRMYRAVENYGDMNPAIVASNVAFQTAFNEFKTKIQSISLLAQADGVPLTGITIDKNVVRRKLSEKAAVIAGAIYAYGATIGDNTLKMEMKFSVSDLMRMREDALAPRCRSIHATGEEHLAALADYGINAEMLADLKTTIDEYAAATPKTRTAISERKTITANLAKIFDETDELLKNRMDKLAQLLKTAYPDFVKTYEAARRIVKMPVTHTQLKIFVTDKENGAPIPNARITARSPEEPTLTAQTDANGEVLFKPIPHGICTINITAAGYKDYETQIFMILGEINDLEAELEK